MSKRSVLILALVVAAGSAATVFAQPETTQAAAGAAGRFPADMVRWSIVTAGFALAIAAAFGALGQGRAISAAAEAIARNPGAAGDIRGALILGLVLIESLVIYVLLISLILFFIPPFA